MSTKTHLSSPKYTWAALLIIALLLLTGCKPEGTYRIGKNETCKASFHKSRVFNGKAYYYYCVPDGEEWGKRV
jgi:hypothetical protein